MASASLRVLGGQLQRCSLRASASTSASTKYSPSNSVRHLAALNEAATRVFSAQYFSTSGSGGGDGKDDTMDMDPAVVPTTPATSTDYSVDDIMSSFDDTSYYDPIDRPNYYSDMTNEELADSSTLPGWELIHSPPPSMPRGALVGTVVSTKMQKTVNVAVNRYKIHQKYRKRIRYTRKFMAHDEAQVASAGDLVMIVPCQRISKHKHFMLREIIRAKGQL